jgi:hypothetical protein
MILSAVRNVTIPPDVLKSWRCTNRAIEWSSRHVRKNGPGRPQPDHVRLGSAILTMTLAARLVCLVIRPIA